MDSDLLATCNALGYLEDDTYYKEPDCLDTVKSLIKYLHHEDNTHDIRVQLGSGHVVRNDLLPILRQYADDGTLSAAVIRLLVNLTQPALLCFGNKVPKETDVYHNYLDILSHNQSYKEDFSTEETWKILAQRVYDILEKDWEDRTPDDSITVERILVLCRNLLHVPATTEDGKQTSDDLSTHDRLIIAMHSAGIDSMILYLASSNTEQQWCLHVAEIISLLIKEQSVDALIGMNNSRERERLGNELLDLRAQEEKMKKMRKLQQSSRHSRFGGTYIAKGKAALVDDNELVLHKSLQKCGNVTYDEGKQKLRKAKNKRPLLDTSVKRRSTLEVRKVMKEFCVGMLENGYNHLMFSVKDRLSREKNDEHDETYYFNVMSFFMEFSRKQKRFQVDLVSETLQLSTLHFIDTSILSCMENMLTDKAECETWGRRMHLALKCYKEFLTTLQAMQASSDPGVAESTKVILNNIFYTSEYREIFLTLLRKYNEAKQTQSFLEDLVQTTHMFIRLFEKYSKNSTIMVEKRVKKKRPKQKKRNPAAGQESQTVLSEEDKRNCWQEIEESIKALLQSGDVPEPGPISDLFDPASDVPEEEQQQQALVKLQNKLHNKSVTDAVGIMQQARELWPEIDVFGTRDCTLDENMDTLKEICTADMTGLAVGEHPFQEEEDGEEEEQRVEMSSREVEFSLKDFLKKFADYKIMQAYATLLSRFETNSAHTNHCVVKMLHRVCYELKMYGLLFQASVFRSFQKIFKCARLDPRYKELAMFGKYVVGKFFEILPENDKLITELLFWKQSATEVCELSDGYGTHMRGPSSKVAVSWSEAENQELTRLYEEYKDGEQDIVDCILAAMTDETRSRRQVGRQLLHLGLVQDAALLKRRKGVARIAIWREDEIFELKRLYEEYADSEDPLKNIMDMMSVKKSRPKIVEKLMSLGLVQDRKELHKKGKRRHPIINSEQTGDIDDRDGNSDADNRNQEAESESDDESWTLIDLPSCVRKVQADGLSEPITWVKSNLQDALKERNDAPPDDTIQPSPLVPLTEDQEEAMDNAAFRKMLHFLGLQKPVAGQEMFWRIPAHLSASELRESLHSLDEAIVERIASPKPRSDREMDGLDVEEPTTSNKRKRTLSEDEGLGEEASTRVANTNDSAKDQDETFKPKRHKRIAALDDSDDDEVGDVDGGNEDIPKASPSKPMEEDGNDAPRSHGHRKRLIVESDDEDKENVNGSIVREKAVLESESEDEKLPDIDPSSLLHKSRKRISVIDDDEDDD